jgi:di/tricarboxylate transporter
MHKFKSWLDATPGLATTLRKTLGVTAGSISNVKHSRRLMPLAWMPVIQEMSGNKVTTLAMVKTRIAMSKDQVHRSI